MLRASTNPIMIRFECKIAASGELKRRLIADMYLDNFAILDIIQLHLPCILVLQHYLVLTISGFW